MSKLNLDKLTHQMDVESASINSKSFANQNNHGSKPQHAQSKRNGKYYNDNRDNRKRNTKQSSIENSSKRSDQNQNTQVVMNSKNYIQHRTVRVGLSKYNFVDLKDENSYVDKLNPLWKLAEKSYQKLKDELKEDQKSTFDENLQKINFKKITEVTETILFLIQQTKVVYIEPSFYCSELSRMAKFTPSSDESKQSKSIYLLRSTNKQKIVDEYSRRLSRIIIQSQSIQVEVQKYLKKIKADSIKGKEYNKSLNLYDKIDLQKRVGSLIKNFVHLVKPFQNKLIQFEYKEEDSEKEIGKQARKLEEFSFGFLDNLIDVITDFENAGIIKKLGRATLNHHTALQKPTTYHDEIKEILKGYNIGKTRIEDTIVTKQNGVLTIEEYIPNYDFEAYFKDKITSIQPDNIETVIGSGLLKSQFYKPKIIDPLLVREIIDYIQSNINSSVDVKKLEKLLLSLGKKVDIANDYVKLNDKSTFSLKKYPFKLAYDYCWEIIAQSIEVIEGDTIPEELLVTQCWEYLKEKFSIDQNDNHIKQYAILRKIRILLARIEHEKQQTEEDKIKGYQSQLKKILTTKTENGKKIFESTIIEAIAKSDQNNHNVRYYLRQAFLDLERYVTNGNWDSEISSNYKQKIGLYRGGLKLKISKYRELTEHNKVWAQTFGLFKAKLRDYFKKMEDTQPMDFASVIIEDNSNKYVLAIPTHKDGSIQSNSISQLYTSTGEYKVYQVKSLTAKSFKKIVRSKNYEKDIFYNTNSHDLRINRPEKSERLVELSKMKVLSREEKNELQSLSNKYKRSLDNYWLEVYKQCITKSKMAVDQNWNEFWGEKVNEITNAKTKDELYTIIDQLGYKLDGNSSISRESINSLIEKNEGFILPIHTQDNEIGTNRFTGKNNRFTEDWDNTFKSSSMILHPEFTIRYKYPLEKQDEIDNLKNKHKVQKYNRHNRFQLYANFSLEVKPSIETKTIVSSTISRKEIDTILKDDNKYKGLVMGVNKEVDEVLKDNPYYYGIDRGLNELATLCVLDNQDQIQEFIVFKKERSSSKFYNGTKISFDYQNKAKTKGGVYRYQEFSNIQETKQSILDLTNLKVETWHWENGFEPNEPGDWKFDYVSKDGKSTREEVHPNTKVLVSLLSNIQNNPDLNSIAIKQGILTNDGKIPANSVSIIVEYPPNQRLAVKAYIRQCQSKVSNNEITKDSFKVVNNDEDLITKLFGVDLSFGNSLLDYIGGSSNSFAKSYRTIINGNPSGKIQYDIFQRDFESLLNKVKMYVNTPSETSNPIDKQLFEEQDELDNLKRGYVSQMVGVVAHIFEKMPGYITMEDFDRLSNQDQTVDENSINSTKSEEWANTVVYRHFELMLMRRLEKIYINDVSIIPPIRNIGKLNHCLVDKDSKKYQFGCIYYVPAEMTSQTCPCCFDTKNHRVKKKKAIICKECGFDTRANLHDKTLANIIDSSNKAIQDKGKYNKDSIRKIDYDDHSAAYIISHIGKNNLILK